MEAVRQRTVKAPVEFAGVGLHSGADCRVVVRAAPLNHGIYFRCMDAKGPDNLVAASPDNVIRTDHGTSISNDEGASVSTVEHLMAALALVGVDNAVIDVFGPETPILDGSAALFVCGINDAGTRVQAAARREIIIDETLSVCDGDRAIVVEPFDGFSLDVAIEFEDCLIGRQSLSLHLDQPCDKARLAKSRTFCRLRDVESLRSAGLVRGGSLENSIVVDGDRLLNPDALRDPEEFVLHKGLDLLGDLYLLGAPIRGAIRAAKPGHALNTLFALKLARHFGLSMPEEDPGELRATA